MAENVNVLEGSTPIQGGLVVRKLKSASEDANQTPKESLFGLDKLAGNSFDFSLIQLLPR